MDKTISEVIESLKTTGKCTIKGFGTFETQVRKGREGVSKLGGVEKAWKTEDTVVVKFYQSNSFNSTQFPVKH